MRFGSRRDGCGPRKGCAGRPDPQNKYYSVLLDDPCCIETSSHLNNCYRNMALHRFVVWEVVLELKEQNGYPADGRLATDQAP